MSRQPQKEIKCSLEAHKGGTLVRVIGEVRRHWRRKLFLRGLIALVAGTVAALFLASYGLEAMRFSATAIIWYRVAVLVVVAGLVAFGVVRPLRRRATDMQVAIYVEEHDPSLEAEIMSAVEMLSVEEAGSASVSPALVERLVDQAIAKCNALDNGRAIDHRRQPLRGE